MDWQPIDDSTSKGGESVLCWHRLWDMPKFAFRLPSGEWKLTETYFVVGIVPTHWFPLPSPPTAPAVGREGETS